MTLRLIIFIKHFLGLIFLVCIFQCCLNIENADSSNSAIKIETDQIIDYSIQEYVAISLLDKKLFPPPIDPRIQKKREIKLSEALERFNKKPDSLDYIIWFGRRLSHLHLYNESVQVYTDGLKKYPESYELYRHRGHRLLTIRQIDNAISDLEKAAFYIRNKPIMMEEDDIPNRRNIPRTSIQFNIWYHLGISYYFKGNYDKSISAFKICLDLSDNDDMLVAATDWLYMTYRRLGNLKAAQALLEPIQSQMNIIQNYDNQSRLLMYKGDKIPEKLFNVNDSDLSIEDMAMGYGVGNWYLYNGKQDLAFRIFDKLIESPNWQALGYLAAEVEIYNNNLHTSANKP